MNKNRIQGGYILLSRKIIESEIWNKPPLYLKIWIYLLSKAQYKSYRNLERGQVFFSIPEIQEACSHYVGFRKESPSYAQVRKAIEWMQQASNTDNERFSYEGQHEGQTKDSMIVTTKSTRGFVANIVNYNVYQDPKNYEEQHEGQYEERTKDIRRTNGEQTIDKKDKKDKNIRNKDIRSTQFDYVISEWNSLDKNISNIQTINSGTTRYKLLKARENEYGKENIVKAIRNINNSSFLKGYEKSWKITFDWFIKPNNFIKVLEGNYDDSKNHNHINLHRKDKRDDEKEREAFIQMKLNQKLPIKIKNKEK